jgi:signal transduction histidine kinase
MPTAEDLALCAHDLRGTLTVIAGYSTLLGREDLTAPERTEAVKGIDAAIRRADALVTSTLSGDGSLKSAFDGVVDLAAVAERAAADARAAYGREVRVEAARDALVDGDEQALTRMLENLLGNAAKYAPSGIIEVRVLSDAELALVEVLDRGPGIPEADRESVLEPFTRLERDAESPGSGLGLTAVRSVAERHAGSVTVRGREGGGTIVSVSLPVAPR